MTAYLIVTLEITDRERFLEYAAAARDLVPKFGGRYLATGRPVGSLEGEGIEAPVVLTAWPSVDDIRAFWRSPEHTAARKLRAGAARVSATIIDGNESGG
jgi:uncharacterized protein (DUF1330 family)